MRLLDLLTEARSRAPHGGWDVQGDAAHVQVARVQFDSRQVRPGDLFACVAGAVTDGHRFAASAVDAGAVALLVEHTVDAGSAPQIVVSDVRLAMAHLAAIVEGDPSRELAVIGVTGTNGKTTTAHLVKAGLDHAGVPTGLVGTLTGARTTPEAVTLQPLLRAMVADGLRAVAMEVSSHALAQHRVAGSRFDIGVFTNLSPDHLDYHETIEEYYRAKASLFEPGRVQSAVINVDDPAGRRLADTIAHDHSDTIELVRVQRDLARDIDVRLDGSRFRWRDQTISLSLPGHFNIDNALAAAEAMALLDLSDAAIAAGLSAAGQVPGRFEVVAGGDDRPSVVVDYSHTPDGIEKMLSSVRAIDPDAEVVIVFGCGGDRDRRKRPLMARAAEAGADTIVVTSDNPRSEVPMDIIEEVLAGFAQPDRVLVEPDRRAAISAAIAAAPVSGVVVVAGKGHETTQTIGDQVFAFDDREVVRDVLADGALRFGHETGEAQQ